MSTYSIEFDMCSFLTARYAEDLVSAQRDGEMLITIGAPQMGVPDEAAQRQARKYVQMVELKQAFLEETVRPYLGAAGLTGLIAARQLRLLVWAYSDHSDYRDDWR